MPPTTSQASATSSEPKTGGTEAPAPHLPPPTLTPTSVAPNNANTNAKIQEQVKVVINDLAKKLHGKKLM